MPSTSFPAHSPEQNRNRDSVNQGLSSRALVPVNRDAQMLEMVPVEPPQSRALVSVGTHHGLPIADLRDAAQIDVNQMSEAEQLHLALVLSQKQSLQGTAHQSLLSRERAMNIYHNEAERLAQAKRLSLMSGKQAKQEVENKKMRAKEINGIDEEQFALQMSLNQSTWSVEEQLEALHCDVTQLENDCQQLLVSRFRNKTALLRLEQRAKRSEGELLRLGAAISSESFLKAAPEHGSLTKVFERYPLCQGKLQKVLGTIHEAKLGRRAYASHELDVPGASSGHII